MKEKLEIFRHKQQEMSNNKAKAGMRQREQARSMVDEAQEDSYYEGSGINTSRDRSRRESAAARDEREPPQIFKIDKEAEDIREMKMLVTQIENINLVC